MIAKPPVTSVELASPPVPSCFPGDVLLRIVWGDAFGKRRCFTLEKRLLSRRIFRKHHAREAFNCDCFGTILSGET